MDTTSAQLLDRACRHLEGACRGWLDLDEITDRDLFTLHEVVEIQHALLRHAGLDDVDPVTGRPPRPALHAAADLLHQATDQTDAQVALELTALELRLRRLAERS